jgi:uncharacterized membrane protein YsdA (DUF1294 family)
LSYLVYTFLALNVFAFFITAFDKGLAIKKQNRISEKWLLILVAFGGTIGATISMLVFRHKTSKTSYLVKFFCIVMLQILSVFLLNKYDFLKF